MKLSAITTVNVLALIGLCLTLATSSLSARDAGRFSRTMDKLPAGARQVVFNGERCWYAGGHYYRSSVFVGSYVMIQQAIVDENDEAEEVTQFLPEDSATVYVNGVRCWTHDGVFYRQVGRNYQKFNVGNATISRKAR